MSPVERRPGRLGIGLIGAGRVGSVLASALRSTGHAVVGATAVSAESRDRVELMLPGVPVLDIEEVARRAELVLVAVPDDVLPELVAGLARLGRWQPGQLVVHTSGRYGTEVLAPAAAAGAIVLAIHPAMTFSGTSIDVARLTGCPFAVTAPAPVLPIAEALVVEIGGEPFVLEEALRPAYHAALAHGSDHLRTVVSQAGRVLAAAGLDRAVLAPLLVAALDGALRDGEAALTGPVARGDAGTVRAHLDALGALAGQDLADAVDSYRHLARVDTARALHAGRIGERTAAELLDVLGEDGAAADGEPGPWAGDGAPVQPAGHAASAAPLEPVLTRTRAEIVAAVRSLPGSRALVMTRGALHEGHLTLVRSARERAEHVVVSILVDPQEPDAATHPRDLEADLALLAAEGVDVVVAPEDDFLARPGISLTLDVPDAPPDAENAVPGLLAVAKLLGLVRPGTVVLGQTDPFRVAAVRAVVRELELDVDVVDVPVRREPDGLVASARNARLGAEGRRHALALSRALAAGRLAAESGHDATGVLAAARGVLEAEDEVVVERLALVDAATLEPIAHARASRGARDTGPVAPGPAAPTGRALLTVTATVSGVRLHDTMTVEL